MEWKTAWSYLPIDYNTTIGTIENITQRTVFWNNIAGNKVKVKFSNLYSEEPLVLDKVMIGQRDKGRDTIHTIERLTYLGEERIVIEPQTEAFSDEITWNVQSGTEIVITIYIKEKTNVHTACSTWSGKSWYTVYGVNGDYTNDHHFTEKESKEIYPYVEADVNKSNILVGISEIKLYTDQKVKTVVLFGDSITHMSYYCDALMERAYSKAPQKVTIINRGIGGNRILHDATYVAEIPGNGKCFGTAAVKRFERDVFERDCPEMVIILEGINDILHPYLLGNKDEIVSAQELQAGLETLIRIAHEKGSKVYLGTIMPFRNHNFEWIPECETVRHELNKWIRNQTIADGVLDFAGKMEKEEDLEYMRDNLHIGDGLHPNWEGGIVMAEAVPMEWILEGIE